MSKFFTYEERLEVQKYLKESLPFKEISRRLDKNPTTISREVRKHSLEAATGYPCYPYNACKNRFNCRNNDVCLFDVRNIDLPRKVKFRERYKKPEFKVDKGCRIGRNYEAFGTFMEKNPDTAVVQMDSVIGSKGGKCLLTIHFVDCSFMLAFLRDENTSKSVTDIFNLLDNDLGKDIFNRLFPIILSDNGSEFSNPKAIECREISPCRRTNVFYCDAGSPYQKVAIEVNHELIGRVLPKGKNFNNLSQEDINLMMNHINSYKRKKLNNRSPYETFSFYHGEEVLHKLKCALVAASDIMLKPALLKKLKMRAANRLSV